MELRSATAAAAYSNASKQRRAVDLDLNPLYSKGKWYIE